MNDKRFPLPVCTARLAGVAIGHFFEVSMPYCGFISVNHYQSYSTRPIVGKDGQIKHIPIMHKPKSVRTWERQLQEAIMYSYLSELNKQGKDLVCPDSLEITIDASFPDKRRRDTSNLVKVIADAVQNATGIDDSNYCILSNIPRIEKRDYGFFSWGRETIRATGEIRIKVEWC